MGIERGDADADAPRHGPDRPEPASRENRTASRADGVLADPERRVAEHQIYRTLVDRAYGPARDQWHLDTVFKAS